MGRKPKLLDYRKITQEAIEIITNNGCCLKYITKEEIYQAIKDIYPTFTRNDLRRAEVIDEREKYIERFHIKESEYKVSEGPKKRAVITGFSAKSFYEKYKDNILEGLEKLEADYNNLFFQYFRISNQYNELKQIISSNKTNEEIQKKYDELLDDFAKVKSDNIRILQRDAKIEEILAEVNKNAAYRLIEKSYEDNLEYKKYGPISDIAKDLVAFDYEKEEAEFRRSLIKMVDSKNE